jgi:hypothetical protein
MGYIYTYKFAGLFRNQMRDRVKGTIKERKKERKGTTSHIKEGHY